MRAAIWRDDGLLDIVERELTEPRAGWVRVSVAAAGICGTDLHFFRASFPSPAGLQPGHEIGGTIDATGEGVEIARGTPVAVEPLVGCGHCEQCLAGHPNRCPRRILYGIDAHGGMAEAVAVPASCVHPLPEGLSAADGALAEPLAVCTRAVRLGGVRLGDRVAILGAGTIGLLSILAARLAGASRVAVSARHPVQREHALWLGAELLDDTGYDVVLETVGGRADTLSEAVALARPGGTVVVLGIFDAPVAVPAFDVSMREIRIVGSNCYGHSGTSRDFAVALDVLARHADAVRRLVTHRFPLAEVNEAMAIAANKSAGSIKVLIEP